MTKFQLSYAGAPLDYPTLGFTADADGAILDGTLFDPDLTIPPDARWSVYGGGSAETDITRYATPAPEFLNPVPETTDGWLLAYDTAENRATFQDPADLIETGAWATPLSAAIDSGAPPAVVARAVSGVGSPGNDWSVSNPGVLQFSPHFRRVPGTEDEWDGVQCVKSGSDYVIQHVYAKGNIGKVYARGTIAAVTGDDCFDPFLLPLPNGGDLIAYHVADEGTIHFMRRDGIGDAYVEVSTIAAGAPDPVTNRRRFCEAMMIRLTSGSDFGSGTDNRIVVAFADIDPYLPKERDTVIRTAYSNDLGSTWSATSVATPTSGATSAGLVDDNQRPWLFEDDAANVNVVYSRVEVSGAYAVGSIWHVVCNNVGASPGTPVKVADAPLAKSSNSLTSGSKNGCSPAVFVARDGYYRLVWGEADYGAGGSTGELRMMSGDGGTGGWGNNTALTHRTDCPNGYGRPTPHRIGDVVEIVHVRTLSASAVDIRSVAMPNL